MTQVNEFDRLVDLNKYLKDNKVEVISITPYMMRDHSTNGEQWLPCNEWILWVLVYEA